MPLAVVSSLARFAQMQPDAIVPPVVAAALAQEHPYEAGIFYDEGNAVAWPMVMPAPGTVRATRPGPKLRVRPPVLRVQPWKSG